MAIDMSAAVKAPPRKTVGRPKTTAVATQTVDTRSMAEKREEGLNGLGQLIQGGCLMTGQLADARAMGMHFPGFAREVANLAGEYEQVAAPVDFLIKIGPFSALIAAGLPLVLQILTNHKVIDAAGTSGVVPPEVLDAQMRAEIARIQAEAMRAQQEAIREAQQAQAEYERMMAEPVAA